MGWDKQFQFNPITCGGAHMAISDTILSLKCKVNFNKLGHMNYTQSLKLTGLQKKNNPKQTTPPPPKSPHKDRVSHTAQTLMCFTV